jgi:hypothetical protein
MTTKATETASQVEQKAKELAEEVRDVGVVVKEATPGVIQIIVLAIGAGFILVAVAALLFIVAII